MERTFSLEEKYTVSQALKILENIKKDNPNDKRVKELCVYFRDFCEPLDPNTNLISMIDTKNGGFGLISCVSCELHLEIGK